MPEAEVLKGLTISRLTALNHGTVRTPIPGRENQTVFGLCRDWAAQVGEIKLGDDRVNPSISIQLSAVDTESILANVASEDTTGNRRRKIKEILYHELGITAGDELFQQHEIAWRGTRRSFYVVYGNVRELTDETLATRSSERKVIIDFPFDPGHTPDEDLARLDAFRSSGTARTLAWLPSFLSASAQKDLGTLVKVDHLLTGERFKENAKHLSAIEQADARQILENQRSQLRHRVAQFLEGAYGVLLNPVGGSIDPSNSLDEHFQSLDPAFEPRSPVGANLRDGFEHLLDQILASQYPAHPLFGSEVKLSNLRKVHAEIERAMQEPVGRIAVDKPLRALLKDVAEPLKLGEMGETHFVLGRHWL